MRSIIHNPVINFLYNEQLDRQGGFIMIYRLLALNVDGTVTQNNGKIHRSVKEAIQYVMDKGVFVTLVTSRNYVMAHKVAKTLKLPSWIVTHHGAYIASSPDKEPLFEKRIHYETVYDLVVFLEKFPAHIRLVHEKYSVSNNPTGKEGLTAKTIFYASDPIFYNHRYVDDLSTVCADERIQPPHIDVLFEREEDAKDAKIAIQNMFYEIDVYQFEKKLAIVPKGVSKLTGLLYLGRKLGISTKEMVYIGSELEDIELIEAVGLGVAMGNSPKAVKEAADWVTRSNQQHGVSYMVIEHFRKQQPLEFLRRMNVIK